MRLREVLRFLPGFKGAATWALIRAGIAKVEVTLDHQVLPLWADTVTTWDQMRPNLREVLRPSLDALAGCRYVGVAVHRLDEPVARTQGVGAHLLHESGRSFAFVGYVSNSATGAKLLTTHICSSLIDNRLVITHNQRAYLDDSGCDQRWVGTETGEQIARAHEERLARYAGRIVPVNNGQELARLVDWHTVRSFEENVRRGVFVVGQRA